MRKGQRPLKKQMLRLFLSRTCPAIRQYPLRNPDPGTIRFMRVTRLPETRLTLIIAIWRGITSLVKHITEPKIKDCPHLLPGTADWEIALLNEHVRLCYNPFFIAMA